MKDLIYFIIPLLVFGCRSNSNDQEKDINTSDFKSRVISNEQFEMSNHIRAIQAIDENTLWYAGSHGQYGFTKDGGKNWTIDSLKHPEHESLQFRSIAVTNEAVFLLCVESPALLYKTTDQGKNWDIVHEERDSLVFYDSMAFWDDQEGIAMGDPTDGCLSVIKTVDGGDTWNKISCDDLPATAKGEAAFAASNSNIALAGNKAWLVSGGSKARVFHSPDKGETWKAYDTPIVSGEQMTGIFSIDMFNEDHGIVIGGNWEKHEVNLNNKAVTHDGGKTWELLHDGLDPSYSSCVQFISDDQEAIALGKSGIYYANDIMIHWEKVLDDHYYTARATANGKCIWLAGSKKIGRIILN